MFQFIASISDVLAIMAGVIFVLSVLAFMTDAKL